VFDDGFPDVLRERLGTACPPFLLVAGPTKWLATPGLGVVGSRDASEESLDAAKRSAEMAVERGWPVVSGLARGVDQVAMAAALESGGVVVGVPAEGIRKVSRNAEIRRRVHEGELCIASPFGPDAPFQAGNAMGRNKIVYALSTVTFVVSSDRESGGTWAGAKEALDKRYSPVAVWTGAGARDGNEALVRRGATPITDIADLFDIESSTHEPPLQNSLF
jgi:predicted Rossmann fold nucleotide-binding protein DprA/Smf involved in DNA uptake